MGPFPILTPSNFNNLQRYRIPQFLKYPSESILNLSQINTDLINNQSNIMNGQKIKNSKEIELENLNLTYDFQTSSIPNDLNPFYDGYQKTMSDGVLQNLNIYSMNNNHKIIGFNNSCYFNSDLTGNSIYLKLDEKETKKLKRKQSNRESARRSRMRKRAEAEELQKKKLELEYENHILRRDIEIYRQDYFRAVSQIAKYREEIDRLATNY